MNIKLTLFTLTLASIVCVTSMPIYADAFRITREKFEDSRQSHQQRDREDSNNKKQQFSKDQNRQENSRRDGDNGRNKQTFQSNERSTEKRFDRYREDRPVKRYDRDRYERLPVKNNNYRYVRPAPGLPPKASLSVRPVTIVKRPQHKIDYFTHSHREYNYVRGPWYYTRYISPYPRHYYPIGYRVHLLPSPYVRVVIGGFPYFYYSGVFYKQYNSGYIVVGAPIGAFVTSLPEGFIAFAIGLATYYYINDTYYSWDDQRQGYVVVAKPSGADNAIASATSGRLMIYPNKGQDEEQQARDRYECHRWATTESGFDPTLEEDEYSARDNDSYRRALAACLEGRDYTVK